MREIKFRAWDKKERLMGFVTRLVFNKNTYSFCNVRFCKSEKVKDDGFYFGQEDGSDNIVLMQYTGLKDKNGRDIYEGDIFKTKNGVVAVVEWDENNGRFLGFTLERERKIVYVGQEPAVEVIANIYDSMGIYLVETDTR